MGANTKHAGRGMAMICLAFAVIAARDTAAAMEPFDTGGLGERTAARGVPAFGSRTRSRLSLAGDWLVQPAAPGPAGEFQNGPPAGAAWPQSLPPAAGRWCLAAAPGSWRTGLRTPDGGPVKEIDGRPIAEYTAAWMVKEVALPRLEAGQKVLLSLDAVWGGIRGVGEADFDLVPSHVYVNGSDAGSLTGWERRRFDITPFVREGRAQIAILNGTPGLSGRIGAAKMGENALPSGMYKPAFIEITRPAPLTIDQVLVTPSVRAKTLKVTATILSDTQIRVKLRARLFAVPLLAERLLWPPEKLKALKPQDWTPEPASLAAATPAAEVDGGGPVIVAKGASEVSATFAAPDLERWSPANPRLYWLSVEAVDAGGALLDASVPVTFGYREVWVDGPDILLNGMRVNLFGASHNYYGDYTWPPDDLASKHYLGLTTDRTLSTWWRAFALADDPPMLADRWGHLFATGPTRAGDKIQRYLNNHPSFILWQIDGNGFVNGPHSHPMQIGDVQKLPVKGTPRYEGYAQARKAYDDARRLDPTRPVFFYRLGWGGDVRAIMAYLDANDSLMDMVEWPLSWYRNARARKVEAFMPAEVSFTLGMLSMYYWTAPAETPLPPGRLGHVEHAARLFGDEAYALVTPGEMVPQAYASGAGYMRRYAPQSELVARLFERLYDEILPAWRAYGISFLLHIDGKPTEHFTDLAKGALSERGKAFRRAMAPLMATIAGPGEDFTARDHAYWSGETVEKQVLLFNDTFQEKPVRMEVEVRATLGGQEVYRHRVSVDVENGRRASVPIEFRAPVGTGKSTGTIEARVVAEGRELEVKSFAFQVFGKPTATGVPDAKIALIDPAGDTGRMLEKAGVRFRRLAPDGDPGDAALLVIGRGALSRGAAGQIASAPVARLLRRGGSVLVFEQSGRQVAGLTNEHFNIREVFVRDRRHPLLAGLTNGDLAYWRGESDILAPYQHFDAAGHEWEASATNWAKHGVPNEWGQRRRFVPQWSNRNMVATFCYQKPQAGSFRVLLDCGFDNLYTPLVEVESGGGRILFCQLDVTNCYGTDPVVTLLVDRMLRHYALPAPALAKSVVAFGDAATGALAQKLGFRLAPAAALDPARHVALAQPGAAAAGDAARLAAFVKDGGTCVVLGAFAEGDLDPLRGAGLLDFAAATGTVESVALAQPPALLAGLGASDFFYRRFMPGVLAKAGPAGWAGAGGLVHVAPVGAGQVAYLAVRPEVFQVEWRPDHPKWQETEVNWPTSKYHRIVSTLLTNAGVRAELRLDLRASGRSDAVYVQQALDFDPMQSYTW